MSDLRKIFSRGRLLVSFSGGRTSGYMLRMILDNAPQDAQVVVAFANTGQEDPRTLEFVDEIDRRWDAKIVWLEAVVDPAPGAGTKHKVVDFASADRTGIAFEAVIAKYGIPNAAYRGICTRELKLRPITSYLRSIGWSAGTYLSAIGIRADEFDRMSANAEKDGIVYPLVTANVTKADVLSWWSRQDFDLQVPEHYGNCVWCWKKSLRKLLTLAKENPEVFEFPARMEAKYPYAGAGVGRRVFFRENRSARDLLALARKPFEPFREGAVQYNLPLDASNGCAESCEIYADDVIEKLDDAE